MIIFRKSYSNRGESPIRVQFNLSHFASVFKNFEIPEIAILHPNLDKISIYGNRM